MPRHARVVPQERDTHAHETDRSYIGLNSVGKVNFDEAAPRLDAKRAEVIVIKMSAKTICLKEPGNEHPRLRRFVPATGWDRALYETAALPMHVLRARM
jgi:hypothetical protein